MTQFDQRHQQVGTQYNAEQITIQQQSLSPIEKQRTLARTRMLDRVETIWIDGVLKPSLWGAAQIALELENRPSAVIPLWDVLQEFDKTGPLSSADTSIIQVYDHAGGEVLILGEPGAGKTTLLLELTRALLERARQDDAHPIPVVFSLSSWVTKQQPLTEWLALELFNKYLVPLQTATAWIKADQVLPLLDGLDEVAAPCQAACVEAINLYRREHGFALPTVVCSRQANYLACSSRLLLRTAIVVQPLTAEQIEFYLESGGERLEALQQALREDADLRALASTPLMLTVLTAAYQGTQLETFSASDSQQGKQHHIFTTYVQRMLTRRNVQSPYSHEHIQHWLTWLAKQMQERNITEFSLGLLQPGWLPTKRLQILYTLLNVIFYGLVGGLVGGLIGIAGEMSYKPFGLFFELVCVLFFGLIGGLNGAHYSRSEIRPQLSLRYVLRYSEIQRYEVEPRTSRKAFPLTSALALGLFLGLISGFINGPINGLISGLISGLIFGLGLFLGKPLFLLWFGARVRRLNRELINRRTEKKRNLKPNQFILLSGRYALFSGLNSGLIFGLISGLINWQDNGLAIGLIFGLAIGLIFGLRIGRAYLQHYALRFLFWRNGTMPWQYVRFLDYAAERILLRKVGGRYIFLHRLLLDYFVNIETEKGSDASAGSSQEMRFPHSLPQQ